MQKILVLIVGSIIAFLMLKYSGQVKQFTGNIDFAEQYLGSGGTNTLIVIVALLIFVSCLMYFTGTLESIMGGTFSPIF